MTAEALQVYQVPHMGGVFRLHPPLREGEHPCQAPGGISVYRYDKHGRQFWRCGGCQRPTSATIKCPHIRQVQEWLQK